MKYQNWITPLAFLVACTGSHEGRDVRDRPAAGGEADRVTGRCAPEDCGGPSSSGTGWCDRACGLVGDCAAGVAETCGLHECLDDVACGRGETCEPGPCAAECAPADPACCAPNRCAPVKSASGAEPARRGTRS